MFFFNIFICGSIVLDVYVMIPKPHFLLFQSFYEKSLI